MSDASDGEDFRQPLPEPEPEPWWRLTSRLRWIFGLDRSQLEGQAFAGVIYAAAAGRSRRLPALQAVAESLQALRSRPDLTAAMACERLYYDALPPADLRAELWALRDRLVRVGTADALAAFKASRIENVAKATDLEVRAEVDSILSYTHKSYQLATVREVAARGLKFWLTLLTLVTFICFMVLLWYEAPSLGVAHPGSLFLGFGAIMVTGVLGAMMSIGRRLQGAISSKVMQDDPLFEIAALELGQVSILLSCLIGAIFALLVYLIFFGAIGKALGLDGGIVLPKFTFDSLGREQSMARALCLESDRELAKMLVIAFVAGFAERLVPDAIDRILSQSNDKK
ncbi:hypothetical protein [Sphingomonas sp. MMS24-J13]|uniref:hypothetical protein n=1 Tax=Sphingomonas sp. MMS24-J13 TaxID=3238686 RepID=UPI00384D5847